ncbi:MAG TPA: hypothetical protein VMK12_28655 [Anaeromyxobacteraceae bacterium]|nr:hypothetical protein [Anaeromyxobacteraceae bacterium]
MQQQNPLPPALPSAETDSRPDILVGVAVAPSEKCGPEIGEQVSSALKRAFPSRPTAVVFLCPTGPHGDVQVLATPPKPAQTDQPAAALERPSPTLGGFLGQRSALPALLGEARRLNAPLCALVAPEPRDPAADWLRLLVAPVLEDGYDFVCPAYRRRKLDGGINTAIVYPLTRALFGRRLRQPLGGELAVSRRFGDRLLEDESWQSDPAHAGADVWLVGMALSSQCRVCQAYLGAAPERRMEDMADLSEALARVLGLLYREMERHAPVWQRITGSKAVPTFGEGGVLMDEAPAVNVSRLLGAFDLGREQLREIWRLALPPATHFALSRLNSDPTTFRLPDELWARVIFDFALAYRIRLIDRTQLLRSMTPLYLGWLASFVNEVRDLGGQATEDRIERLCKAFEASKSYLIARWRWPDRFSP